MTLRIPFPRWATPAVPASVPSAHEPARPHLSGPGHPDAPAPHPEPAPAIPIPHGRVEDVAGLLVGVVLVSLGLFVLKAGGVVTGGTAGVALTISYATGWSFPLLFALVNLPFLALAIGRRGWSFTLRSLLCIVGVSLGAAGHALLWPPVELPPIYAAIAGNVLCGMGVLALFRHKSSVGGFGILALILQDRFGWRAGWLMLAMDAAVLVVALTVLPPLVFAVSAAGAIVLNGIVALNHRPGRYTGG
ncbi:YitT family protein [Schumannella soli]|uniref:YitT family protein n=1 Tax=Schumannella soli TaxID=2590779 RepID=UPI00210712B0|nr:YitT family protein [Schumannella soli]